MNKILILLDQISDSLLEKLSIYKEVYQLWLDTLQSEEYQPLTFETGLCALSEKRFGKSMLYLNSDSYPKYVFTGEMQLLFDVRDNYLRVNNTITVGYMDKQFLFMPMLTGSNVRTINPLGVQLRVDFLKLILDQINEYEVRSAITSTAPSTPPTAAKQHLLLATAETYLPQIKLLLKTLLQERFKVTFAWTRLVKPTYAIPSNLSVALKPYVFNTLPVGEDIEDTMINLDVDLKFYQRAINKSFKYPLENGKKSYYHEGLTERIDFLESLINYIERKDV